MIDPHRLAEERSLAYHRVVAQRLPGDPRILEHARARVRGWRQEGKPGPYTAEWERVLAMPLEAMKEALVADTEAGRARRQATPFAGSMTPRERWKLWREVRQREELSR